MMPSLPNAHSAIQYDHTAITPETKSSSHWGKWLYKWAECQKILQTAVDQPGNSFVVRVMNLRYTDFISDWSRWWKQPELVLYMTQLCFTGVGRGGYTLKMYELFILLLPNEYSISQVFHRPCRNFTSFLATEGWGLSHEMLECSDSHLTVTDSLPDTIWISWCDTSVANANHLVLCVSRDKRRRWFTNNMRHWLNRPT